MEKRFKHIWRAAPYTFKTEDDGAVLFSSHTSLQTITLPDSPVAGYEVEVSYGPGLTPSLNITVLSHTANIDGNPTFVVTPAVYHRGFIFDGTNWTSY
jgi:hypothetical protein